MAVTKKKKRNYRKEYDNYRKEYDNYHKSKKKKKQIIFKKNKENIMAWYVKR